MGNGGYPDADSKLRQNSKFFDFFLFIWIFVLGLSFSQVTAFPTTLGTLMSSKPLLRKKILEIIVGVFLLAVDLRINSTKDHGIPLAIYAIYGIISVTDIILKENSCIFKIKFIQ